MVFSILKKDLKRRKGVNIILFLFITIATVFLASSVNNIMVVGSATDDFLDKAKVPDVGIYIIGTGEKNKIETWLEEDAKKAESYSYDSYTALSEKGCKILNGGEETSLDANGAALFLSSIETNACRVFDDDGNSVTLNPGEVVLSQHTMTANKLKEGDRLRVTVGDSVKTLTIKMAVKDAAFGQDIIGVKRLVVSEEDYAVLSKGSAESAMGEFNVKTKDANAFEAELNKLGLKTVMSIASRDLYEMAYVFDMIMAAMLILVGVCLILIALLVLRFTLVFTLEEDYREIGIMKASGFRNFTIKKIYLVKYLAIVSAGALLGLLLSFPVSGVMVDSVSKNVLMEDESANQWVNVLCTMAVVVIVMLFCYFCTRKLNKVSAITAIRNGQSGERFTKLKGIKLHTLKRTPVPIFLGANDLLSHVKRFAVLMITFCISFVLITIPLNTLNTMSSDEMVNKFSLDPESAICVRGLEVDDEAPIQDMQTLNSSMVRLENQLKEKGYDGTISCGALFSFTYKGIQAEDETRLLTIQIKGKNNNFQTYSKGTAPKQENEMAFSEAVMDKNGWEIGDTIELLLEEETLPMIITGEYSDYMQLGDSARLNPARDFSEELLQGYWSPMIYMQTDKTSEEVKAEMKKEFPDYVWATTQEIVDGNVGNIQQSLKQMVIPMTALLCGVIMLITLLMAKLFIVREKGEIAMMKSVGFRNGKIRMWQVMRMVCVVIISVIIAVPLSLLNNQFLLKPIFAIMGANVEIQVVPWQVYGVYPAMLLIGIIMATVWASRSVKKINIRELNNLE